MQLKKLENELKDMKLIAHRLGFIMTKYPENSLDAIKDIFKNQTLLNCCDGFEFDICFTKDNIPILVHDKYIDDITDNVGYVRNFSLSELKKMNFTFRKTLYRSEKKSYTYTILTLDDALEFFKQNIELLKDKIIKIETKEAYKISKKNMFSLAQIINKFPELQNNLIHLSYWPQNLRTLKRVQKKYDFLEIQNDLLCDYKIMVYVAKIMKSIDNISLRIKTSSLPNKNEHNTKRVNRKIFVDKLFMSLSNTIDEKLINNIIKKYGSVGLFVLNDVNEMNILCKKLSYSFLKNNKENIVITTDNPLLIKKQNIQK